MDIQGFLKTKIATVLLFSVLVLVSFFTVRILWEEYKVNSEISKLKSQADKIQKDNEQLTTLIKYLNTPEYQEKQAREQLNLKKQGEFVVGLPSGDSSATDASQPKKVSNARLWFDYFFNSKGE